MTEAERQMKIATILRVAEMILSERESKIRPELRSLV